MWFEKMVGFKEITPEQVRKNLVLSGNQLISKANNRKFVFGNLETPSLEDLRRQLDPIRKEYRSKIKVSEIVGNIQTIHKDVSNNRSAIQVASQFNLLEMVSPNYRPEDGVAIYENDLTQGPACAITCGAGTIYRNYFAEVNGRVGQSSTNQIDCLKKIGIELGNDKHNHWEMKNGYALAKREGLWHINNLLRSVSDSIYEHLKGKLMVGVQWDTEVTICEDNRFVTQIYCSALPVAYSHIEKDLWRDFARMILEAAYEATLYIALKNHEKTKNNQLFLTLLGGGAFGNEKEWIFNAIGKAVSKFANTPLDLKIVSHGASNSEVQQFVESLNNGMDSPSQPKGPEVG